MIEAYKDLLLEIDILTALHADLVRQLEQQHRVVWTGMAPSAPMPVHVPLDKSMSQYNNLIERLTAIEGELKIKRDLRAEIDNKLEQMDGLNHTIAYKRFVEGKSLKEIAVETGYAYSTIRKKSMAGTKSEHTY
ncbi:hypothetical protein COLU111180_06290 [Cohnella lubricantis]|uniref:Uncharacterized protein n=1 Tax=Cohnella lubricantis TaxID=2163172 RepID=A0A841T993_9BACL|nr:hypothetical protein [Cohnella lubricantis]MBB6677512.1 hypothetical protein [Cohnella lubricantis]MBP2116602.1 DNA-directed RNA polymerase specialized sigma24 family protein [Cohnella lubricantis]